MCFSDSLHVIQLITGLVPQYHKYVAVIWDIKDKVDCDWVIEVTHTLRE